MIQEPLPEWPTGPVRPRGLDEWIGVVRGAGSGPASGTINPPILMIPMDWAKQVVGWIEELERRDRENEKKLDTPQFELNGWTPESWRMAFSPTLSARASDSKADEFVPNGTLTFEDIDARVKKYIAQSDLINHPPHYTSHPSGVECIVVTEHMGFCLGNAVKYIWRADEKGNAVEDLKKAQWYIAREIARRERAGATNPNR